ncbi:hypothetical protein GCM10009716_27190 [Streptomyces sodiiphilus]|uniref:Uncharacterized protein n=1 Tax=Streptomyces sodiiphilus TaxID=226217 RepID=A0ABN2PB21_9ACTN
MAAEGLEYVPEGFRQGGSLSHESADRAENAHARLRTVSAGAGHFGGAETFTAAVNSTRDRQSRGVERASEGRQNLGDNGWTAAAIGEEMDADGTAALGAAATSELSRHIADGI